MQLSSVGQIGALRQFGFAKEANELLQRLMQAGTVQGPAAGQAPNLAALLAAHAPKPKVPLSALRGAAGAAPQNWRNPLQYLMMGR